jgi:hypothetical protein
MQKKLYSSDQIFFKIKEFLYNYNPAGDHRKLIAFQYVYEYGTIVQSLIEVHKK